MKPDDVSRLLSEACEDQRADLKRFAETGDQEALARVHFDTCPECDDAVEALIGLRDGLPPAPMTLASAAPAPRGTTVSRIVLAVSFALSIVVAGFLGYLAISAVFDGSAAAKTEAERAEALIRYVPMPGFPGTCVAAVQGVGGYGPTYLGAAPCADVRGRFDALEGLVYGLQAYSVVRIRGTSTCLAHGGEGAHDFTFACGSGD